MVKSLTAVESEVRSYSREWPATFGRADGSYIFDRDGEGYLDFFMGAGALNYGHNSPNLRSALMSYLESGAVVHSLDMNTVARDEFLETFGELVLGPRALDYRIQFCGGTGTNSVEAALKLARKVTGRSDILAFSGGFHGMSLGSLAVTANSSKRQGAGTKLHDVIRLPFENSVPGVDELALFEFNLSNGSSGLEVPAAVIVETVQGEGGINVASAAWIRRVSDLCSRNGILLIVDDIQMGCGRTGGFFSWSELGVVPDMVCMSKSLSGFGIPMSILLMRPELDIWKPGEHNGTFRGFNPAFVTASRALSDFWSSDSLSMNVSSIARCIDDFGASVAREAEDVIRSVRGRGAAWGFEFTSPALAESVSHSAFNKHRLIVERCGHDDSVIKLLPALNISTDTLNEGLSRFESAIVDVSRSSRTARAS